MSRTTISVIEADIGSIGGHLTPSQRLVDRVRQVVADGAGALRDYYIGHTGDDVAILMTHVHGVNDPGVHRDSPARRCCRCRSSNTPG